MSGMQKKVYYIRGGTQKEKVNFDLKKRGNYSAFFCLFEMSRLLFIFLFDNIEGSYVSKRSNNKNSQRA